MADPETPQLTMEADSNAADEEVDYDG